MITKLYCIRRPCRYDGIELRLGDWWLWETGFAHWRPVSVWRSTEERDVALAVMGLKAKDGSRQINDRLVETEMEELT